MFIVRHCMNELNTSGSLKSALHRRNFGAFDIKSKIGVLVLVNKNDLSWWVGFHKVIKIDAKILKVDDDD